MKIASYNIWNSEQGRPKRDEQIAQIIELVDADVIGLQEVSDACWSSLSRLKNYTYKIFMKYAGEDEGLAFLSKLPIVAHSFLHKDKSYPCEALNVVLDDGKNTFSVTNVHLSWNSAILKEQSIVSANHFIKEVRNKVSYNILLGDFNIGRQSSVHEFLIGARTINGQEANPYWLDLASAYSAMSNTAIEPTLDYFKNPRWKNQGNLSTPFVADRIYFLNPYPKDDPKLINYIIFGKDVSKETELAPSDHYGVCADLDFE